MKDREVKKIEHNKTNSPKRGVTARQALIAFFLAFFLGIAVGTVRSNTVLAVADTYDELETFADVLSLVETNYVEDVDPKKLVEGAINGMLRALDPHSSYMTPEFYKEMQVETEGEFGGLGIEITIEDGWLTVVTPMEDTPAWKAGVKAGDKIVKVDGEPTHDMTLMESVRKIRGKRGTKVTITIMREGFEEPKDFIITREIIHIESVKSQMLPDKYGYIRIRNFSKDTGDELTKALSEFQSQGMKGLVLDLRNNPGGLLNQAVEVSEQFLDKGELIVYTKGRLPSQNLRFASKKEKEGKDYPMVALVNQGSASASEIVAGALQDLKRAVVVGTQTFGKGSVQTIIPLKGDAGLRLTTARYYTPAGRQIQGVGITPDIVVEQTEPAAKVKKATTIREKDLKNHLERFPGEKEEETGAPAKAEPETENGKRPVADLEKDVQLQRAVAVLKSWEIISDIQKRSGLN